MLMLRTGAVPLPCDKQRYTHSHKQVIRRMKEEGKKRNPQEKRETFRQRDVG